jgi:predicted MFS family arabinose efflux permease
MATHPAVLDPPIAASEAQARKDFGVILLARLALNMQMRVVYPFLPAISRGLGLPLQTTSLLLTVRALANLSSPLYGMLSDRFGRRTVMMWPSAWLLGVPAAGFLITVYGWRAPFVTVPPSGTCITCMPNLVSVAAQTVLKTLSPNLSADRRHARVRGV